MQGIAHTYGIGEEKTLVRARHLVQFNTPRGGCGGGRTT